MAPTLERRTPAVFAPGLLPGAAFPAGTRGAKILVFAVRAKGEPWGDPDQNHVHEDK